MRNKRMTLADELRQERRNDRELRDLYQSELAMLRKQRALTTLKRKNLTRAQRVLAMRHQRVSRNA